MRCPFDLRLILSALLALVIGCTLMVVPATAQGPGYSMSLSPVVVGPGGTVAITWSKPNGASSGFFGLYKANNFSNLLSFTSPAANANSGTATLHLPDEPGGYWIGWIADGVFKTTAFFQIVIPDTAGSVSGYSLSVNPNPVNAGGSLSVNWTKPAGTSTGLIGLYDSSANSPGTGMFNYLDVATPIGDTS